jgi:hypothetical protein
LAWDGVEPIATCVATPLLSRFDASGLACRAMLRVPRSNSHADILSSMLRRAALPTILIFGLVAPAATACDWDPTGECGGTRWSGWSTAVQALVLGCGAFGVVAGAFAWLILPHLSSKGTLLRAATAAALILSGFVFIVGQEYVNWPNGRPAGLPASVPQ